MGHKVQLPPERSQPRTSNAKDDTSPIAHPQFRMRIFLEELDAVEPKEQSCQGQAHQEVCCDQQRPCHHNLHWGEKKKTDRGLRNDQRICLPPPQLLLVALLESPSLLLGISVGDADTRTFPQPYVSLTMYVLQPGCSSETLQQDLISLLSAQLNKPSNLRCTSQHLGYGCFLETFTSLCV